MDSSIKEFPWKIGITLNAHEESICSHDIYMMIIIWLNVDIHQIDEQEL